MHEVYGIDLGDRELLRARSWRWLSNRILGLLSTESRLKRKLFPDNKNSPKAPSGRG